MIVLGLILAAAAAAESAKPVTVGGYLKDVYQYSSSSLDNRPYFLNTSRLRLTLDANVPRWRAHVDYDQEVLAGSYFRTRDYAIFGVPEADMSISSSATHSWRHHLYRGWLGFETDSAAVRFGRQRIAWGTGKLWNPTDVLNPYQPLSVERDERKGVDALYARTALGLLSQAELAWALEDAWPRQALLGRIKGHAGECDVSLMGGKIGASTGSWIAGGDFAASLWDGTLRGEWSYTAPQTRTPYWKADVGYEYTFPSETRFWPLRDAAVVAEYYHSGAGAAVAQDYFGATYAKDLHPLLKLELVLLTNANDGSQFFSPSAQWNALENFYLTLGLQRFGGPKRAEFGRAATLLFAQGQVYF